MGSGVNHIKHNSRKARATFPLEVCAPLLISELSHKLGHEIGNPLTSIISISTIIERFNEPSVNNEKRIAQARSIISEAWKISTLVEKYVVLVSDRELAPTDCDISDIIRKTLRKLNSASEFVSDEIVLRFDSESPPYAHVDEQQLIIVLKELIVNASEAIRKLQDPNHNANISIEVKTTPANVVIEISNPISEPCSGELADLFKPMNSQFGGTNRLGIGLTVASKILDDHEGVLEIENYNSNDSCYFLARILLPAHTDTKSDDSTQNKDDQTQPSKNNSLSVLIIEDQETVASAIRKILEFSYKKKVAHIQCECVNGPEAIQLIKEGRHFDAILCDVNLSPINGMSVYRTLEACRPEDLKRFAFMTGAATLPDEKLAPCLSKPFEPEQLLALVQSLLEA